MARYIEIDKLINDICNSTEPFNIASVIRIIQRQPVLVWNDCEDCVYDGECDTHPMHCNSFRTPAQYLAEVNSMKVLERKAKNENGKLFDSQWREN